MGFFITIFIWIWIYYYEKSYFKWTYIVRWLCTLLVQWLVQLLRQQKRLNGLGLSLQHYSNWVWQRKGFCSVLIVNLFRNVPVLWPSHQKVIEVHYILTYHESCGLTTFEVHLWTIAYLTFDFCFLPGKERGKINKWLFNITGAGIGMTNHLMFPFAIKLLSFRKEAINNQTISMFMKMCTP